MTPRSNESWRSWNDAEKQRYLTRLQRETGSIERFTFADLKVRTKGTDTEPPKLVTFTPNDVQSLLFDAIHADHPSFEWRNGIYTLRGAREDILKARQQGVSTGVLGLLFLDTVNNPLTQTIIIADNGERSEMLFKIVHRFWEHLPRERRPKKKYSSKRELEFTDLDSVIYVGTAGQGTVGRGGTINNVLESEFAYYADAVGIETGLLESVPAGGNVFRETTANGLNAYYTERQAEHRGDSSFRPRFFGWNLTREYRLDAAAGIVPVVDEKLLATAHGLDDRQLAWRRDKLRTLKDKFPQEYPLTEQEAFISSGNPYFDRDTLMRRMEELQDSANDPIANLVLSPSYPELRNVLATGKLAIWETPNDAYDYIVSADPAGGIDTDGKRDACSASVLCVQTWEQVAHLHGLWEPRQFAAILAELGEFYGESLIGVHRKNHGVSVLDNLLNTYHYPRQIGRRGTGVYFYDPSQFFANAQAPNPATLQAGFDENTRTKPFMLDKLGEAVLAEPGLKINSKLTVGEMLTFVHLPGGAAGGESGTHDDCVSDLALGATLLDVRFERKRRRRERQGERMQAEPVTAWSERHGGQRR